MYLNVDSYKTGVIQLLASVYTNNIMYLFTTDSLHLHGIYTMHATQYEDLIKKKSFGNNIMNLMCLHQSNLLM